MSPGGTGFDPPKSQIEKLVLESWSGIRAMALHVKRKFSISINVDSDVKNIPKKSFKSKSIKSSSVENAKSNSQHLSRKSSKIIVLKQDYAARENIKENIASMYLISRTQPLKPTITKKRQKK